MGWFDRLLGRQEAVTRIEPRAAVQSGGPGAVINTSAELESFMRDGAAGVFGETVTPDSSMRQAAVFACVRIRSTLPATLPLHLMRRIDPKVRENASDEPLGVVLRRRPNRWQTPSQFRRMMHAHFMVRGNAYAVIVRSLTGAKDVQEVIPLHPDRVRVEQLDDLSLRYHYTRAKGGTVVYAQGEIFHLLALTFNGYTGVTPLTYARETVGMSQAMERHSGTLFRNATTSPMKLRHPGKLGIEGQSLLRASLDAYRSGGDHEGQALILEEGMDAERLGLTSVDAQWIEARRFSRTDIAMFFGVPPHMIGDTEKSTSWGTGIEQQTLGYLTFTAEDDLTMWEETINRDLIADAKSPLYARFNRAALVKADIKTRWDAYAKGRQMKVLSANDVREREDMNPVDGGDVYENPYINIAADTEKDPTDDAPPAA